MAKEDFNLGGSKAGSVISQLRTGLSSLRQEINLLKNDTGGWVNTLSSGVNKMHGGSGGASSNQVAPYPTFSSRGELPPPGGTSSNIVFNQGSTAVTPYVGGPNGNGVGSGSGGGGGISRGALFAGSVGAIQAMPGTKEAVEMQLATSRMVFYQQQASFQAGGFGGNKGVNPIGSGFLGLGGGKGPGGDYNQATAFMQKLQNSGTTTSKFDAAKAFDTARQYGIGGPNLSAVMEGNAQMSNITPGIGIEGATRAYGAVQQGRSVNMLRGIGIKIRGEDGSMKPMPQIIDELWTKITREMMGGGAVTVKDVAISLQPGNALASMLDQYFGNDPLLRKQVEDGLMMKARTGGAKMAGADLKKSALSTGASTSAVQSLSERITESSKTLQQVAPTMAGAFTFANRILSHMTGFFNLIDRFTGILKGIAGFKAGGDTLLSGGGIGGGFFASTLGRIPIIGNLFKAEGGPVGEQKPYIVGERGPELFVPKVDGTIVPNHELKNNPFRANGGNVTAGGYGLTDKSTPEEWAKAMLVGLNAPTNKDSIDALKTWARFEGGNWKNSAHYNPLNTTYGMPGAEDMNSARVKAYQNWEQGIQATIKTLTGSNADKRGYSAIIAALREGKDKETILDAINKSAWVHGEGRPSNYQFNGSSSDYSAGSMYKGSGGTATSTAGEKFSMSKFFSEGANSNKNLLSDFVKGFSKNSKPDTSNANTYNYGGVTVNLSGGGSPEANVAALKAALSSNETLAKAAQS
jgi:hypothetical protein